jgi:flagellar basal-body rod modification protein FlgD
MPNVNPLARTDLPDPNAAPTQGSNKLGKDEFLKLLMAQMGSQDPTSPSNSEAFVAQLATFAQLELQQRANANLEHILMAQAAANQTSMLNFVGKDVSFRTDRLTLERGQPAVTQVRLSGEAEKMTAVITDASGKTVRTIQLPRHAAGQMEVSWDGRDDHGNQLQPGNYKIRVTAEDADGASVAVEQSSSGHVRGVAFRDGVAELQLSDGTTVKVSDVVEIKERTTP